MTEFKAELVGNNLVVKPIIEKVKNSKGGTDVKVKIPSFQKIQELQNKFIIEKKDGKRDIQQI